MYMPYNTAMIMLVCVYNSSCMSSTSLNDNDFYLLITHKKSRLSILILTAESTEWVETMKMQKQMQMQTARLPTMLDTPLNLWRNNCRCQWVERKRKFRTLSPLERSLSWKDRRLRFKIGAFFVAKS